MSTLYLQKLALNEACSSQTESLIALAKLKSYGLTEDRLLELNSFLENNGYKDMNPNSWIVIEVITCCPQTSSFRGTIGFIL